MRFFNSEYSFGVVTKLLHWSMAILILGLIILGFYMTRIPLSPFKLKLYRWHKEFGMLVFMLLFARFFWRIANMNPILLTLSLWEKVSARAMHWIFYFLMFLVPLTGWLLTSSVGLSVSFFGLFLFPDLISPNENARLLYTQWHHYFAYLLLAGICLHTLAALKHHFLNHDDILRRIL